jgi:hypothetical protein
MLKRFRLNHAERAWKVTEALAKCFETEVLQRLPAMRLAAQGEFAARRIVEPRRISCRPFFNWITTLKKEGNAALRRRPSGGGRPADAETAARRGVFFPRGRWPELLRRGGARALRLVVVGLVFGWFYAWAAPRFYPEDTRPGFGLGMMHGALMPMALPSLLMGRDVPIYATVNSGRPYKLGYIAGINGCGFLFFGLAFWRPSRPATTTRK